MIAISFFGIAKDTTAKNPPTQINHQQMILIQLTPAFHRIFLENTSFFSIKFAVSAAYKSLHNGDTVIIFLIVTITHIFYIVFLASFSTEMLFVCSK